MARIVHNPATGMKFAEVGEVGIFASNLSDNYLLCREMGHNWRPWAAQWNPEEHCFDRVLRCTRCKTKREQSLSSSGSVVTSHYEYPEGYQHKGFGRISGEGRDRLRLESVTRAIGDRAPDIEE